MEKLCLQQWVLLGWFFQECSTLALFPGDGRTDQNKNGSLISDYEFMQCWRMMWLTC